MGELARVAKIDGNPIGTGQGSPLLGQLSEAFRELTRSTGTIVVD